MSADEQAAYDEALRRIAACLPRWQYFGNVETDLYLDSLGLTRIPPEIGQLFRLQSLNLSGNKLNFLPPEIGDLTSLVSIDVSNNLLRALPPEIGRLHSLERLILTQNLLTDLPSSIGNLAHLGRLDVDYNRLDSLPSRIGELHSLRLLGLSNNYLTTIPTEVGELDSLEWLDLENNNIQSLPVELKKIHHLRELRLRGNPSLLLPTEIIDSGYGMSQGRYPWSQPRELLDYVIARQEQGGAPMQEVRVLLVGRGRVGKTSLLRALQNKSVDLEEPETPGITVTELPLECAQGQATAHAWDFGGQEFLHATHQIFLSERCVYVLVLEGRDGNWEPETDYWLRFIQSLGGESPVITALNKYDLHVFSVDRHRLMERCPHIVGFIPTDAVTGRGIDELRSALQVVVGDMKDVWADVPKKWHQVKEALEQMPENFLEFTDYQTRCAQLGVIEQEEQESLAGTLHRLGIALNFREHQRLKHTSVLKPKWVTNAIYSLIRFVQARDCHGVLRAEWLAEALQPVEDYPADKHDFVLDLMARFEVAFPLDGDDAKPTRWLIPELLGETQPEAFAQFRQPGVQRLRFTYPEALPPGLLPRLIVRTHELSEGHPGWRWRSGVVLEWAGSQALVRLDRLKREMEVAVIGPSLPERQALFDLVRSHLVELHGKVRTIEEAEAEGTPGVWVRVTKLRQKQRQGTPTVEEYTDDETPVEVPVTKTLSEVESPAATVAAGPDAPRRLHLFVSYAHTDEKLLAPFRQHLTLLGQRGYIQVWHDRDLVAGEKWGPEILEALNRAEIVLLFYTTGARVSKFIQETELPLALDRSDRGDCAVIWVPLERNDLSDSPLEKRLAALACGTQDKREIYSFEPPQIGWMQVEKAIQQAVEKRRALDSRPRG